MATNPQTVPPNQLQDFARRILAAVGLSEEAAGTVATCLVNANLRGVDSHGVLRLIQYAADIGRGDINPQPEITVVARERCVALIDAGGGYGFVPTLKAIELAVELARREGVGVVGVRNSHHFGMAATYVERAIALGMIGIVTTNTGAVMAPTGGRKAGVGNNPIAFGIPRRPPAPAIVFDMALTQTAFGRIRLAAAEGRPIPIGWAFDTAGRPTTDSAEALRARLLAPVGGHKGYGLALVIDVLAGILTGSNFGANADAHRHFEGGVGHLVIALKPDLFIEQERFLDSVEILVEQTKSAPLAEGATEIYVPGELEWTSRKLRETEGIPISDALADQLAQLAREQGVSVIPELNRAAHP